MHKVVLAEIDKLINIWEREISYIRGESRLADELDADALYNYRQGMELCLSGIKKLRRLVTEGIELRSEDEVETIH